MRLNLTEDMVRFVAEMLNDGASWAAIGREFGVSGQRIKSAYLRGSRAYFGNAALRAGLTALGWTADSPDRLSDEAEQIAREERADCG
jgi:hypothetical protein